MPPDTPRKRVLIAFLTETFGGAEANGLAVARAVARTADLEAHAAFPAVPSTAHLRELFSESGVMCHDYRAPRLPGPDRLKKPMAQILALFFSIRMLRRVHPDLVYVVLAGPLACTPLRVACALLRIPTLGASQLTPAEDWSPLPRRTRLYRWLHSRGHQLVALCEHNRQWLLRAFELPEEAVTLVYNGVPECYPTEEGRGRARALVRRELGLREDAVILLTVGRLGIQKGHDLLLPILDGIVDEHPAAHFVWLGEGERAEALERARQALRHAGHLHLPGWQANVQVWLQGCDLFVFPTYYEGLPRAVMEALSAGIPIVASAVSSIPEIVVHEESGMLVGVHDPEAWRNALLNALNRPEEMAGLGCAAQKRAPQFSETAMLSHTLSVMRAHLSGGDVAAPPST